jgi:hypothetical protein
MVFTVSVAGQSSGDHGSNTPVPARPGTMREQRIAIDDRRRDIVDARIAKNEPWRIGLETSARLVDHYADSPSYTTLPS